MAPMTAREKSGIVLLAAAIVAAPMAYFLGQPWGWLALIFAVLGLPLFVSARVSRKWAKDANAGPDFGGELKGFPGHRIFRNSERSGAGVDDE